MSKPLLIRDIDADANDVQLSATRASGADGYIYELKAGNVSLGSIYDNANSWSDGEALTYISQLIISVTKDAESIACQYWDYLTINGKWVNADQPFSNKNVYLPDAYDTDSLYMYVDSNGLCYLDSELTELAYSGSALLSILDSPAFVDGLMQSGIHQLLDIFAMSDFVFQSGFNYLDDAIKIVDGIVNTKGFYFKDVPNFGDALTREVEKYYNDVFRLGDTLTREAERYFNDVFTFGENFSSGIKWEFLSPSTLNWSLQ